MAVYGIRVPLRKPAVFVLAAVLPVRVADSSKAACPAPVADMRAAVPHTVRVVRTVAAGTSASGRLVAAVRKLAAVFRLTVRGAVPEPVVVLAVQRAGTAVPRQTGFPHQPVSVPPGYGRQSPVVFLSGPAPVPASARSGLRNICGPPPPRRSFSTVSPFSPVFLGPLWIPSPAPSLPPCFPKRLLQPAVRMFRGW